ncbi:MAG: hypothetical protein ACI8Q1_001668 [Parvicella sp.]|jgi:hypothetical protein
MIQDYGLINILSELKSLIKRTTVLFQDYY